MSFSTSTAATFVFQQFHSNIYSRRLLLHSQTFQQAEATSPLSSANTGSEENNIDADVVLILSVLLCAVIFSLGLNSIIRCILRCSRFAASESSSGSSVSLPSGGIPWKALKTFPVVNYSGVLKLPGLDVACVICLAEFAPNQRVKVLPKCNHGFHVRCIDRWLTSHSTCPICRNCLIQTCQKIVGCSIPNITFAALEVDDLARSNQT